MKLKREKTAGQKTKRGEEKAFQEQKKPRDRTDGQSKMDELLKIQVDKKTMTPCTHMKRTERVLESPRPSKTGDVSGVGWRLPALSRGSPWTLTMELLRRPQPHTYGAAVTGVASVMTSWARRPS